MKDIVSTLTMKQLEQITFRALQDCSADILTKLGTKGVSPVVQELAIELAVTGVSYRQTEQALKVCWIIRSSVMKGFASNC